MRRAEVRLSIPFSFPPQGGRLGWGVDITKTPTSVLPLKGGGGITAKAYSPNTCFTISSVAFDRSIIPPVCLLRTWSTTSFMLQRAALPHAGRGWYSIDRVSSFGAPSYPSTSVKAGTVKEMVVPFPLSLSARMRPPCASTRLLAMLKPRPAPPVARALDLSVR